MIGLIDYGVNNLRSVEKACAHVGASVALVSRPKDVARADKLILPGVGAFPAGMAALESRGLAEPIRAAVRRGMPLLGICLGMQLLFEAGEEVEPTAGLGLILGRVGRLRPAGLKVPHMGWNQLRLRAPSPLLAEIEDGSYVYFVHSYACEPGDLEAALAVADYGGEFPAAVRRGNVYGIQFHPEKSQAVGLRLLRNFFEMKS